MISTDDPIDRIDERINLALMLAYGFAQRSDFFRQALQLLGPGQLVVDLGAAPGAWSQYVRRKFAPKEAGVGGAAALYERAPQSQHPCQIRDRRLFFRAVPARQDKAAGSRGVEYKNPLADARGSAILPVPKRL